MGTTNPWSIDYSSGHCSHAEGVDAYICSLRGFDVVPVLGPYTSAFFHPQDLAPLICQLIESIERQDSKTPSQHSQDKGVLEESLWSASSSQHLLTSSKTDLYDDVFCKQLSLHRAPDQLMELLLKCLHQTLKEVKASSRAFAIGARQLVVHDAFDMIVSLPVSVSSLTPKTTVGIFPLAGAEITTFLAPAVICFPAPSSSTNLSC